MATAAGLQTTLLATALVALSASGVVAQSGTACDTTMCPFGYTCIATDESAPAQCLPTNPCLLADCGDGFTCDLVFSQDQCLPAGSSVQFPCAPKAVCKPNSVGTVSNCGPSNKCQGSFQLCAEQLDDPEACFDGSYDFPEECETTFTCLNPTDEGCNETSCPNGTVCAVSLEDPQGCAQSPIYEGIEECNKKSECVVTDPCSFVTCPSGAECEVNFDPTEECLSNTLEECPTIAVCNVPPNPCLGVECLNGFKCFAPTSDSPAICEPVNPCAFTHCGDGLACDQTFVEERCSTFTSSGKFDCLPVAICRNETEPLLSNCADGNTPCPQSNQLCQEELEDPEECFLGGGYDSVSECEIGGGCAFVQPGGTNCDDLVCPGGLICALSLLDPQNCDQYLSQDYGLSIELCQTDSECVPADPCTFVQCPAGFVCTEVEADFKECRADTIDGCFTVGKCVVDDSDECPERIKGDVNDDGSVDVSDVVIITGFILGTADLDECLAINADINEDGDVTVADVVELVSVVIG